MQIADTAVAKKHRRIRRRNLNFCVPRRDPRHRRLCSASCTCRSHAADNRSRCAARFVISTGGVDRFEPSHGEIYARGQSPVLGGVIQDSFFDAARSRRPDRGAGRRLGQRQRPHPDRRRIRHRTRPHILTAPHGAVLTHDQASKVGAVQSDRPGRAPGSAGDGSLRSDSAGLRHRPGVVDQLDRRPNDDAHARSRRRRSARRPRSSQKTSCADRTTSP